MNDKPLPFSFTVHSVPNYHIWWRAGRGAQHTALWLLATGFMTSGQPYLIKDWSLLQASL